LSKAIFFINTSLEDAGPGTLMKAMCKGCIPINFPTGIALDIVNETNGFITTKTDYKELAEMIFIATQLSKEELIHKRKATILFTKEQLDEHKTYEGFLRILQQIIDNHKVSGN